MSLDYRPDSDRKEVLADYVGFVRLIVKIENYPGTLPALPMTRSTAAAYYSEQVCQTLVQKI